MNVFAATACSNVTNARVVEITRLVPGRTPGDSRDGSKADMVRLMGFTGLLRESIMLFTPAMLRDGT
jgi:hypothetical protein